MQRVFIFVNGILNFPGDSEGWTDRAVTWTHIHTHDHAEKYEYLAGALTRRFRQQRRAEKLAKMISFYNGRNAVQPWDVHLVGHSNGCDVILRTLDLLFREHFSVTARNNDHFAIGRMICPVVRGVHLISPACEADFEVNGLSLYLANMAVGEVTVRIAGRDRALNLAALTAKLRPFGLGYGTLGKTGPINAPECGVTVIREPDFGHSTWFEEGHFDALMKGITA